ncbi:MAG: MMPL family transporter [Dehalococcoidia bacterium]|nr:MMPL family transporter [Dehalococcoidia bacterium]
MPSLGWPGRLATWSARHRWTVIGLWLVALVVISGASASVGGVFTTEIEYTNSPESQEAKDLLEDVNGAEPLTETVIVRSEAQTVDDPEFQALVGSLVEELRQHPEAFDPASVTSYYELSAAGVPQAEGLVSEDRRTTLIPATLVGTLDESTEKVDLVHEIIAAHEADSGFDLLTGGFASINQTFTEVSENDLASEFMVMPFAFIILIVVFGAVVAAFVPMMIAFLAIGISIGVVTLLSQIWPLSFFVTNVILTIGLAVGIDYALFIVERFREQRRQGDDVVQAIGHTGDTASRAVLFSGITVVIALTGMLIVPASIFRSIGLGAATVVILSVLISLTALPALLSALGDHVNRLSVPFLSRNGHVEGDRGFWAGAARTVMARPAISALLAGGLLVALSVPYFSMELGANGAASIPESYEVRRAFDILNDEFSAGRLAPTSIVVQADDTGSTEIAEAFDRLGGLLAADGEIQVISQVETAERFAILNVSLPGDGADDPAIDALERLREDYIPQAFEGTGATVLVGGNTALNADLFTMVDEYTPIVFAFVLGLSFVLLLLVFRSIVVPAKALVMNLLSVGAAYGVVVAVLQQGFLADQLGFQTVEKIEAWLPLFLFTILFGLSMDYHVFLLSRIRERYDETHRNSESVAFGLRSTANIITGAAAIMVVVFSGFALGELVMFQQIGLGLAVAVFLDATVVRTVLVPSTMRLLGDWNWYLPSWLEWLPDLRVERQPGHPVPAPAPAIGVAERGAVEVGVASSGDD